MCLAVSYGRKLKWEENHFDVKAVPLIIPEIQGKERLRPTANGWCMCCYSYFCYVSCVHAGWGSFITGESFSALFSSLYHCDSAITLNVETFFLYSLSCSSSAEDSDKFFLKEPGIWKVLLKIQTWRQAEKKSPPNVLPNVSSSIICIWVQLLPIPETAECLPAGGSQTASLVAGTLHRNALLALPC